MKKFIWVIPVLVIFSLFALVFRGVVIMHKENTELRNNCAPTKLFIIGNKGHKTRVYDCSE